MELRSLALRAFSLTNPVEKVQATQALWRDARTLPLDTACELEAPPAPGRPPLPQLVLPQDVPRRSPYTPKGHAALIHSITHIEFNAINLALDAIWRFPRMPADYYHDWLRVAMEEAKHFTLLHAHLQTEHHQYGDFVAHDGLWNICDATRHDVMARMALVPRTLEARGLDATPIIQAKLQKVGSARARAAVDILNIILEEEVGHVAIGNRWFHWLCQAAQVDPEATYRALALQYDAPKLKPPFNMQARKRAGFTEQELAELPV